MSFASFARRPRLAVLTASLFVFSLHELAPVAAHAQSVPDQDPEGAICMSRVAANGDQLRIILPVQSESAMQAQGYGVVPCQTAFPSAASRLAYRDNVCRIASMWREELQRRFAESRGVRSAILCGMAEQVVGPWDRRGGGQ